MASLPRVTAAPHPKNFKEVQEFMRPKVMPFIEPDEDGKVKGWIHLLDPTLETRVMDVKAGTYVVQNAPIHSCFARIQPIRNTVSTWRASNPTTTRMVQFWIEFPPELDIDVKPGLRIAVEVAGNDPWLTKYQYVVLGALNSAQAWQRTIDAQVDLENRPNYDMSAWPTPGEMLRFGDESTFGEETFGVRIPNA